MNNLSLNNILNEYNYNQRLYNENIRRMINLLENTSAAAHSPTPQPSNNRYFMRSGRNETPVRARSLQEQIMFFLNSTAATAATNNRITQQYPTQEQIEQSTENLFYSTDANLIHTVCPISLDTFQPNEPITRIRHCGHIFRADCLRRWFQNHTVCPVCRYDILRGENNPVTRHSREITEPRVEEAETEPEEQEEEETTTDGVLTQLLQSLLDLSGSTLDYGYSYTSSPGNNSLLYEFTIPIFRGRGGGAATGNINIQTDDIENHEFEDDAGAAVQEN